MQVALDRQNQFMNLEMMSIEKKYETHFQKAQSQQVMANQELQQAHHKQSIKTQELQLHNKITEDSLSAEISSLRTDLEIFQSKEIQLQTELRT